MSVRVHIGSVIPLALSLALQGGLIAQQTPAPPTAAPAAGPAQSATPSKKAVLSDAVRVSTAKAMQGAAKQKVAPSGEEDPSVMENSAVKEFRTVPPGQEGSHKRPTVAGSGEQTRNGPLKNVHGSVYGGAGATNSETHAAGAAAGVKSKSGKTSVYIEGQRARESSQRP